MCAMVVCPAFSPRVSDALVLWSPNAWLLYMLGGQATIRCCAIVGAGVNCPPRYGPRYDDPASAGGATTHGCYLARRPSVQSQPLPPPPSRTMGVRRVP
jgi:hypothetical protein